MLDPRSDASGLLDAAVLDSLADAIFSDGRCRVLLDEFVEGGVLRQRATAELRRWQNEQRDLERRRARILEAIELGDGSALGALTSRLREVETTLAEVDEKLQRVALVDNRSAWLDEPEVLSRIQERLRATLHADQALARAYLRELVERIVVAESGVEIIPRTSQWLAGQHHRSSDAA